MQKCTFEFIRWRYKQANLMKHYYVICFTVKRVHVWYFKEHVSPIKCYNTSLGAWTGAPCFFLLHICFSHNALWSCFGVFMARVSHSGWYAAALWKRKRRKRFLLTIYNLWLNINRSVGRLCRWKKTVIEQVALRETNILKLSGNYRHY